MNSLLLVSPLKSNPHRVILALGTISHVIVFIWTLAIVICVPTERKIWAGIVCIVICKIVYPISIRQLICIRNLLLMIVFVLPLIFWEATDKYFGIIPVSNTGLQLAIQMAIRFLTIMMVASGFTSIVDIAKLTSFFDRFGLNGLGFSMGVALNIFPALKKSSINSWNSLKMRGGLRQQRAQTIKFLVITIIANALHYADDIALAAESRAYDPKKHHRIPIEFNPLDFIFIFALVLIWAGFILL